MSWQSTECVSSTSSSKFQNSSLNRWMPPIFFNIFCSSFMTSCPSFTLQELRQIQGLEAFTGTYSTQFFSHGITVKGLIYCGTVHRLLWKEASWYYYNHHINRSINKKQIKHASIRVWNPCSILKERKFNSHSLGNKLSKMLWFKFQLQRRMEGFLNL